MLVALRGTDSCSALFAHGLRHIAYLEGQREGKCGGGGAAAEGGEGGEHGNTHVVVCVCVWLEQRL